MDIGALEQETDASRDGSDGLSRVAAARFAEKWKNASSEKQLSQAFWHSFFQDVIGISDLQEAGIEFEKRVISSKRGTTNFIDVFWKDTFLVEQKSAGKDMDVAEAQARDYVVSLPPALRPPVVIVCDFARFRIVDILLNKSHEFVISDLPDNLSRIEAVLKHRVEQATHVQVEADQKAAKLMADLYVQLEKFGYEGHDASVFMVRILFCLFADDTRMWKTDLFYNLVMDSNPLGTDLGPRLSSLFQTLNTPKEQRLGPRDPLTADFPYVNGGIFSERIETINFNSSMRNALMNACLYDWSSINPTIFGALFQNIKSKDERHANGEHYTTEKNIEKTIKPLFLDDLDLLLEAAWDSESKLKALQRELGTYQIFDPACGCGNFLITAYKRLRQLELDIITRRKQLDGSLGQTSLIDVSDELFVKLEQLHGIEYVEWSSQIAKVAIYLTDHQENLKLESVLGVAANRFPLSHSATIVQGNALQIDWAAVCPMTEKTIIVGNPPFLGQHLQSEEQKADTKTIWGGNPKTGVMDYVSNWFVIAATHIEKSNARAAFVSTSSISQGEQPAVLWKELWGHGVEIKFAHRSFAWMNESKGKAAVHCVIVGIGKKKPSVTKRLWTYENPKATPCEVQAKGISPYLTPGPEVVVETRQKPLSRDFPPMLWGSKPTDNGHLSKITPDEANEIRASDPIASKFLRRIIGAEELINGGERYCLWLEDASPSELRESPVLRARVQAVREMRLASVASLTRKNAEIPHLFVQRAQPTTDYIGVPLVSSENRQYIPFSWVSRDVIASNATATIPDGELWLFSVLCSGTFNFWAGLVSGRLESRIRLSAEITYNNFPFPTLSNEQREALNHNAEEILEARARYPEDTLAALYDPISMPLELRRAHQRNDRTVLSIFGLSTSLEEFEVLDKLLERYAQMRGESPKKEGKK
jgi:hypothetical protein